MSNQEPNYTARWLAIGLVLFGLYKGTGGKFPFPLPTPTPSVPAIPPPSDALKAAVAPITAKLKGDPVAPHLAGFLGGMADAVQADVDGLVKNNATLQKAITSGIVFAFPPGVKTGPEGTAALLNSTLLSLLGNQPGAFDRQKAVDALRAMAWACQEAA
jgi:hypothetical protein